MSERCVLPLLPLQTIMPISAQQWRVSVGLFNCSRMRWLLKGGGAKKKARAPSPSKTNARVVKGRVPLLLLYLMAVACVTPPLLLLIRSGDVELNPGPVEAGKQLAVLVEGRREGGRRDVPRGVKAFCYNCAFEFLCLTFSFPRLTVMQTWYTCHSSHGSGVSCRVVYRICSTFLSKQCSDLQCHLEVKGAVEPSLMNKWKKVTNLWNY